MCELDPSDSYRNDGAHPDQQMHLVTFVPSRPNAQENHLYRSEEQKRSDKEI